MTGSALNVAAFLSDVLCEQFARAVPECRFHHVDDINMIPRSCGALMAAPSPMLRDIEPPARWPGEVRWVHLLSTGIDNYPAWLFDDVIVSRSPAVSAVALAEYCLTAILMWARHRQLQPVNDPTQWQARPASRLSGSNLGIAGMGAVGAALASRALALGMTIRAIRGSDRPMPDGVERAGSLAELFATSDHLVLAMPAGSRTHYAVDSKVLAHARPGLHLVNVARGSLINDADLIDALDREQIAYATLDVTDPELLPAGHMFYTHPAIRLTPHSAAYDDELLPDLIALFADNARRFSECGVPLHIMETTRPPVADL